MTSAIGAVVVVAVAADAGITVVELAVVTAVVERVEMLDVDTRGLIEPPFSQKTRLQ